MPSGRHNVISTGSPITYFVTVLMILAGIVVIASLIHQEAQSAAPVTTRGLAQNREAISAASCADGGSVAVGGVGRRSAVSRGLARRTFWNTHVAKSLVGHLVRILATVGSDA